MSSGRERARRDDDPLSDISKYRGKVQLSPNPPALRGGLALHKGDKKLENQPNSNQSIPKENLILIDWITFTSLIWSVEQIKCSLGLMDQSWDVLDHGFHGYKIAEVFNGVTIMYDGRLNKEGVDDMGICVEISGQGCRALETFGGIDWLAFLTFVMAEDNEFHVTRLDLAFDDHTGILDKWRLKQDSDDHNFRSKFRTGNVLYNFYDPRFGFTIGHGSKHSDAYIRIYDKAAERGLIDGTHWIRVEIQLRDKNAAGAIRAYLEKQNLGAVYGGFLATYLVYLQECNDKNISRWPIAPYWAELIQDAERIHVAAAPGVEYNIFHLEAWLRDTAGGGLLTWIEINGLESLPELLKDRKGKLNPKHKLLLDQHRSRRKDGNNE